MGGEKFRSAVRTSASWGSPPRGRGKEPCFGDGLRLARITPAWAGKSASGQRCAAPARDHPRVGGEKIGYRYTRKSQMGSPPHGRGKGFLSTSSTLLSGSPPHRRGKVHHHVIKDGQHRITPAWAGKSSCISLLGELLESPPQGGEKELDDRFKTAELGSPPRRRGKVHSQLLVVGIVRITPAWAGKRPAWRRSRWPWRDHPRVGGEKTRSAFASHRAAGSPPRGRGKGQSQN